MKIRKKKKKVGCPRLLILFLRSFLSYNLIIVFLFTLCLILISCNNYWSDKEQNLTAHEIIDYPSQIDSVINNFLKSKYQLKLIKEKKVLVHYPLKTIRKMTGSIIDDSIFIDSTHYHIAVRLTLNYDTVRSDLWYISLNKDFSILWINKIND